VGKEPRPITVQNTINNTIMNWKIGLDRYLTSEPDDGYDGWFEQVVDNFTDEFYYQYEEKLQDPDSFISKTIDGYWDNGYSPKETATQVQIFMTKL